MTLKRSLGYVVFITVIFLFVDGLLQQVQLLALNKKIIIPSISIKVILILAIIIMGLIKWKDSINKLKTINRFLILTWLAFGVYLIIEVGIFKVVYKLPISYSIFNFNSYFFCLILLPFIYFFKNSIEEKVLVKTLILVFIPLSILGILQFLLNSPILPTESADHGFSILSWNYYGKTRAFSLFVSGLSFGHFIALISGIAVVLLFKSTGKYRVFSIGLLILTFISGYTTLTRNSYIEIMITVVSAVIFNLMLFRMDKVSSNRVKSISRARTIFLEVLPLIYGLIGVLLSVGVPLISKFMQSLHVASSLFKMQSTQIRYNEWVHFFNIWFHDGILRILFGTGLIQNSAYSFTKNITIDNSFLAVGLDIGLIGMILWLGLVWLIWRECLKMVFEEQGILSTGVLALFSTWMIVGIFNLSLVVFLLAFYLILIGRIRDRSSLT